MEVVNITNKPDLLSKMFRFRYAVFCEEMGYKKLNQNGVETDQWDADAIHFAVFDHSGRILGAARLILDSELGLPCEKIADIRRKKGELVGEISRGAVLPQYRNGGKVLLKLVRSIRNEAINLGVSTVYIMSLRKYGTKGV